MVVVPLETDYAPAVVSVRSVLKTGEGLRALHWLFLVVLGASCIPLGSNRVFASACLSAALVFIFFAEFACQVISDRSPLSRLRPAGPVLLALMGYLALLWLQAGFPFALTASVEPHSTWHQLLLSCGYASAFALVLLQVKPGTQLRGFVRVLIYFGVCQALVAVFLYADKAQYELFRFSVDHSSRTYGTFSYHNSLANYLVICLCLGVGLLVAGLSQEPRHVAGWRSRLSAVLTLAFSGVLRLRVMLLVMVVALVLTKSRMGNAAFLLAVALVAAPFLMAKGRLRFKGLLLLASIVLLDVLFIGKLVGLDEVAQRLNSTTFGTVDGAGEESIEDRSVASRLALEMVAVRPLTGFGAGSFYTSFPQYASADARMYYDHAHNDFVQFAVEVGLVGSSLLALVVLCSVARAVSVMRRPLASPDTGIALGFLMAVFAALLQATVDFHFQIPANALLFVVVLSIPWLLRRQPLSHS
ncbi:MAG: O-antigen ligase family protein [Hydrogenophaga sp.]|nr:O-antigen ligase family protein [Hydrogenophaga sp.]